RGEMIYIAGRPAHSVYAIRNGSVKTYAVNGAGDEIVQGFYLPGEVIGLESLSDVRHDHFAVALEPTLYCEIQATSLKSLLVDTIELRQQVMDIMNERLRSVRHDSIARARRDAAAQLAAFLMDLSCRNRRRGLPANCLRLSMDRRDIANFLGLSVETVSRSFTRLQQAGWLDVRGKSVLIAEPHALEELCGTTFIAAGPTVRRVNG
ncbi:MAG: helix-turn-helix domain-containing protein, partial [Halioglobus sp.]|nr:helix-turn-helix domain-containing protein [Halioglobus sp.]